MYSKCSGYHPMDCCSMPKMKCKPEKECVGMFKMYRMCHYHMTMVCHYCGHEFDYHHHRGMCPRCSGGRYY
jgi:hypothetical protein